MRKVYKKNIKNVVNDKISSSLFESKSFKRFRKIRVYNF